VHRLTVTTGSLYCHRDALHLNQAGKVSLDSQPKRHHVVPLFYLRGFSQDDRLHAVRISDGRQFSTVTRKAASEKHFYRLADDYEDGPLALETAFGSVETEASKVMRKIEAGEWPLAYADRQNLSFSIGVQLLRGPRYRKALETSGANGTNLDGSPMTSVEMHAYQIATLAEEWMPQLMERPWDLVRFVRRSLITSDSPVSAIKPPDYKPASWTGAPFAAAKTVSYPLRRKLGLMMRDRVPPADAFRRQLTELGVFDRSVVETSLLARSFNESTTRTATSTLYHHPSDASFVPALPFQE
jgi:hypothetical protein